MQKFRIKVDLSTFFDDYRKYVYILVDPSWTNVECLQERVEQVFDVTNLRFTTDEGVFVPPQESIEVIKTNDVLKAFVPSETLVKSKKKKKKHDKTEHLEMPSSANYDQEHSPAAAAAMQTSASEHSKDLKKRKYISMEMGFTSSTPNHAKRSKSTTTTNMLPSKHSNNTVEEISSTNEQLGHKKNRTAHRYTEVEQPTADTVHVTNNNEATMAVDEVKKKRKHKKKKNSTFVEEAVSLPEDNELKRPTETYFSRPSTNIPSSTFNQSPRQSQHSKAAKKSSVATTGHVYFNQSGQKVSTTNSLNLSKAAAASLAGDDSDDDEDTANASEVDVSNFVAKQSPPKIIFRCMVADLPRDKPRVFALKPRPVQNAVDRSVVTTTTGTKRMDNEESVNDECSQQEDTVRDVEKSEIELNKSEMELNKTKLENDKTQLLNNKTNPEVNKTILEHNKTELEVNKTKLENKKTVDKTLLVTSNSVLDDNDDNNIDTSADDSSVIAIDSDDDDDVSDTDEREKDTAEVIDLNFTEEDTQQNKSYNQTISKDVDDNDEALTVKNLLPFSTTLEVLPELGDIIIFKMLRKNKTMSEFIACKCEYTNKRTKTMKLLIIDGHEEITNIARKHFASFDDSITDDKHYLQLKMCDLVEAKLLAMS